MGETILVMEGIHKRFPGVHALNNCRFELKSGEVHALLGENGAGKSTLMKVLTGVIKKDEGKITFLDEELNPSGPRQTQGKGISIIHQELNLMPHLTAAQNIFIGREPRRGGIFVDDRKIDRDAEKLFQMLGLNLNPRVRVSEITVAAQQMVEIAKALSFNSRILIMDEPTAALTEKEIQELFKIIRDLKTQGVGIVYISHRMEELMEITDRISIMRDGEYIKTLNTKESKQEEIIRLMVGRTLYEENKEKKHDKSQETVLEVKGLTTQLLKNVSFTLHRGEILGFAGLMGAGRTEVARAIFGADPIKKGNIKINGQLAHIRSPQDAVRHGIGYLSEDRKRYGLTMGMSVEENTMLASLDNCSRWGFIDFKKTAQIAEKYVNMLKTKTPGLGQDVKHLSGGNQQKVIIAKWLVKDCDILIFDEPTRGIDVGAKNEIYKLLSDLAQSGKSIIMISSELPEILRMSDRIAVMCEGRITGILEAREADQESIIRFATRREEINETEVEHIE